MPSSSRYARAALAAAASIAASSIFAATARAQSAISYSGGTYLQNFDTLPSAGGPFTFVGPGPFDLSALPVGAAEMQGWQLARGDGGDAALRVSSGTSTAGSVYSFGAAGAPDRALGSLGSGSVAPVFGAVFVNSGVATLNSFTINFTMEQWRNGGSNVGNALAFSYALGGANLLDGSFTAASSLDAVSVINAGAASALDGNLGINQQQRGATVSGLNWLPGQTLVIRWNDFDDSGNDHGIGIDDFSLSAAGGARDLIWNPGGPGGTSWSTSAANVNWLNQGSQTFFNNGDVANFTSDGVGSVIIDVAGVAPGATNFSNENGTYFVTGGAIFGGGALVKTGNGSLILNNVNAYTGGTVINGGTLFVNNNENLGAGSSGITLGGGSLNVTADLFSARAVTLAGGSVSTIATNAASVTFGAASGTGSFVKAGTGTVAFNGPYTVNGTTAVLGGALVLGQNTGSVNLAASMLSPAGDFAGDLVIANPIRVNFNSGVFAGGGAVRVQSSGALLSTNGALIGQTPTIDNDIHLNVGGAPGPFVTTIGATAQNTMTISGVIGGASDVIFSSSGPGAGTGVVVLADNNTFTGATTINLATAGVVRLAVSDALPVTTDLTFGTGSVNVGALDLAGRSQSIRSLRSDTSGTVNGIANTSGSADTPSLTITGSASTTFAGTIGVPPDVTNLPGATPNITLVLGPTHTGELTLAGANNHTGGTVIQGGALAVASDAALGAPASPVSLAGGTLRLRAPTFTSDRAFQFAGTGGTIDVGANEVSLLGPVGGPGAFNKAGTGTLSVNRITAGALNVLEGEVAVLDSQPGDGEGNVSIVQSLYIANGPLNPIARLNLNDNGLIASSVPDSAGGIPGDGGGPEAGALENTQSYIGSAYAGGGWTGNGITSGTAVDRPGTGIHALGYAQASTVNITIFGGHPVLPTDILIKFTRHGDADLNGIVNLQDFNRLAANFGGTGKFWAEGDFNYNGIVNLQDFNLLAANFGLTAGADGVVDPADWAALASAVPEPASVGLIIVAAGALLARRRR